MSTAIANDAAPVAAATPRSTAGGDWAIRARGIGKRYRLGGQRSLNDNFREDVMRWMRGAARGRVMPRRGEEFWALRDIDLDVARGETVGIIGRNGAGKSTLLKILSRITTPTEGELAFRGRLASLLEVGTGFHRELTGRENIYLNGAILGMRRAEIDRQFDAIVDFAGVEKFLDTPVKHYSSGMYVRLAFAVAAHLRTDILVVDEVLAVGDAEFQKKCLGKMKDVAEGGRTVLFVSHNMAAVESLCGRAVWLKEGRKHREGAVGDVISAYLDENLVIGSEAAWPFEQAPGDETARLRAVRVIPRGEGENAALDITVPFDIEIDYENRTPGAQLHVTFHLLNEFGAVAFSSASCFEKQWQDTDHGPGIYRAACHVPGNFLNDGLHRLRILLVRNKGQVVVLVEDALAFQIADSSKRRAGWYGRVPGAVRPLLEWQTMRVLGVGEKS